MAGGAQGSSPYRRQRDRDVSTDSVTAGERGSVRCRNVWEDIGVDDKIGADDADDRRNANVNANINATSHP